MKPITLISAALAGFSTVLASAAHQQQFPSVRRSRLRPRAALSAPSTDDETNPPDETYNGNWAGAVLTGAGYRTVTGTITLPPLRLPPGADSNVLHAVSAWVGIDGQPPCPNAILQLGVDMYLNASEPSYSAWIEWYPNHSTYLTDFAMLPGDRVTLNLTAPSLSSAAFTLANHRTGQTDRASLTDQQPLLCGFSAEWMVEDFLGSNGVPLVDFGSVTFTGAKFATDTGVTGGVADAGLQGIREKADGPVVVECGKVGGDSVTCVYQGPGSADDVHLT
ncbi:peptidase A4 family-domain-containing protein [Chaetomium strumarium]|uniref:Peptidase A4 family-domain-containing protein n=1 Tax=Chaetomium strumarium TaxID=1170767 RepID=A0AAJ0GNI2_9PEZI|nr:peptidase A4 family-domain-containing protein [Chaetomium strumarium]